MNRRCPPFPHRALIYRGGAIATALLVSLASHAAPVSTSRHTPTTDAYPPAVAEHTPSSRIDLVTVTPAPFTDQCTPSQRHRGAPASNGEEKCGSGPDWDIAHLMELLAQNKGGHTTFTEKKYMSVLDTPLVSTGVLLYQAPDHLEKRTLTPKPESFVLNGDVVTIKRGKKKYILQLHDYPKIAVFTESIRGTLAGDRTALEQSYHLSLDGTPNRWLLTLSPTDSHITDIIQNILVHGEQGKVISIEIHQLDGDYSVMTIGNPTAP